MHMHTWGRSYGVCDGWMQVVDSIKREREGWVVFAVVSGYLLLLFDRRPGNKHMMGDG